MVRGIRNAHSLDNWAHVWVNFYKDCRIIWNFEHMYYLYLVSTAPPSILSPSIDERILGTSPERRG